jgi:hypothetical protein
MSKSNTTSLLDDMLEDASEDFTTTQADDRARSSDALTSGEFGDVEELLGTSNADLCKILAGATRDDLLTVISSATDGLRRKMLTNLSPDSARWIEQNLAYFDKPTRSLLATGRANVLAVANGLVREGSVVAPRAVGAVQEPSLDTELERVLGVANELLGVVQRRGTRGLATVVHTGDDPMLKEAVGLIVAGADEATLAAAMDATSTALLARYQQKLRVVREAALALHQGEDPDAFRRRISHFAADVTSIGS